MIKTSTEQTGKYANEFRDTNENSRGFQAITLKRPTHTLSSVLCWTGSRGRFLSKDVFKALCVWFFSMKNVELLKMRIKIQKKNAHGRVNHLSQTVREFEPGLRRSPVMTEQ